MSRVSLSYAVISDQDRRHHQRCCFTSLENCKPVIYCRLWVRSLLLQIKHSLLSVFISSSAGVLASLMWMKWRLFIRMRMTALHAWEGKLWESWLMLSALNTAVFQKDLIFLHLFCLCVRNSMRHLLWTRRGSHPEQTASLIRMGSVCFCLDTGGKCHELHVLNSSFIFQRLWKHFLKLFTHRMCFCMSLRFFSIGFLL